MSSRNTFLKSRSSFLDQQPIDKSCGRVLRLNGHIFYSPNCQREVKLPPPSSSLKSTFPRNSVEHDVAELHQPLWWDPDFVHLAFLPLEMVWSGYPFHRLFHLRHCFDRLRQGYSVDPSMIIRLQLLERELQDITKALMAINQIPPVSTVLSTALGCTGVFKDLGECQDRARRARAWFSVWVASLSYAIAASMTVQHDQVTSEDAIPNWFCFLASIGWKQSYLTGLQASLVGTFNPSVDRTGIFLDIIHPEQGRYSVSWFSTYSVPVWYPWTSSECKAAETNHSLGLLAPLPHQLQEMEDFMTKVPSNHPLPASSTQPNIQKWVLFFQERDKRNKQIEEKETHSQRQKRLDRERSRPKSSTKAFTWTVNSFGEYERQPILRREFQDYFDSYGVNQRRYDSFRNEWDFCEEFGDFTERELEEEEAFDTYVDDTSAPVGFPASPPRRHEPQQELILPTLQPVACDTEIGPIELPDFEALDILYHHYGFLHPLPVPKTQAKRVPDDATKINFTRQIGMYRMDDAFFESSLFAGSHTFIQRLQDPSRQPQNDSWDLSSSNRIPLATSRRLGCISLVSGLYVFDFKKESTMSWKIAIRNPADALFVCRLDPRLDDYEIGQELLRRGISFHTLVSLPRIALAPLPKVFIPMRLSRYVFTVNDYDSYVEQRAALFSNPRVARAALLRGGITWRLAMQSLGFDVVLQGPTTNVTLHGSGISFPSLNESTALWDDDLSETELSLICGLHKCFTGQAMQYALKSWWPLDNIWKQSSMHSFWTVQSEQFFSKRLQSISSGSGQPRSASEWRGSVRGPSNSRNLNNFVTSSSQKFLQTQAGQGP